MRALLSKFKNHKAPFQWELFYSRKLLRLRLQLHPNKNGYILSSSVLVESEEESAKVRLELEQTPGDSL